MMVGSCRLVGAGLQYTDAELINQGTGPDKLIYLLAAGLHDCRIVL